MSMSSGMFAFQVGCAEGSAASAETRENQALQECSGHSGRETLNRAVSHTSSAVFLSLNSFVFFVQAISISANIGQKVKEYFKN